MDLDLSRDILRVFGIDPHLHIQSRLSAGIQPRLVPMGISYDWGALRHSVSYGIWEPDAVEEFLDLRVEGGASEYDFLEIATERGNQLAAELLLHDLVQSRYLEEELVLVDERLELGLVDLLDDERHSDDDARLDFRKGLHDDLRAWHPGQEMHVRADSHLEEELEHHSVHMRGRQHGHPLRAGADVRFRTLGELDIGPEGPVRNHHALGEARSA